MSYNTSVASLCCLKAEYEMRRVHGCLYESIENTKRVNRDAIVAARAVEDSSDGTLTEIVSTFKTRPGDPTCTEARATVKYENPQKYCEDPVDAACTPFECAPGATTVDEFFYDDVEINECVEEKFSFNLHDFDCSCESPDERYARRWVLAIYNMYAKRAKIILQAIASGAGAQYGEVDTTVTTPMQLKVWRNDATGAAVPQPLGWFDLYDEFHKQNPMCGLDPIILTSSKKIHAWAYAAQLWEGNDRGNDASKAMYNNNIFFDRGLAGVIGGGAAAEPILAFLPGAIKIADWYEFANPARADRDASGQIRSYFPNQATGSLVRRTMDVGSNVLGFPWFVDVQFYYEECENTVHVHMKNHFAVCKLPDRAFCPNDTHNYCILADAVCSTITCDDLC